MLAKKAGIIILTNAWTRLYAASISAKPDFVVFHALFFLLWLNRNDADHSYVVVKASAHTLIK
jgi:hypothetical protein